MNGLFFLAGTGRKPRRLIICCAGMLVWGLFGSLALLAQFTTASLSGTVLDPSGAAVPAATMTVQNSETSFTRTTKSGNGGDYLFPVLPVGEYTLTVVKPGFHTYAQKGIVLTVNRSATQMVTLKPGKETQEAPFTADASLVTTSSAAVGQLVNQKITVAYVGNNATHLYGTSDQEPMADINAARYVPGNSTEANTQQRRPYPNFGPMGSIDSGFNSNYDAIELNVEKYLSHGLSFLANYTWSRNFSDFSESLTMSYYQTNPFSRNYNYGPSESDIPYVFKFSGTWEIPHFHLSGVGDKILNGWELAPIFLWQSGVPYSIMSGLDNSFTGDFSDRADFIGT